MDRCLRTLSGVEWEVLGRFSIMGVMGGLWRLLLGVSGVLLPVVGRVALLLGNGWTDDRSRWDDRPVRDRVPASCWWALVGCWWALVARSWRLPSRPWTSLLLAMLLLHRAGRCDVPMLLTVIAYPVGGCCCHQRALHDLVSVIGDVEVRRKVRAEIIDHSLQHRGMCWFEGSAPDGACRVKWT